MLRNCIKGFLRAKKLWVNPPKAERAKPSLSSDYNLLFKNKIGERSLDIHRVDKHYLEDQVRKLEGRIAELEKELATTQTALESSRRELDLIQKNHESGQAACIEMMENANRIIETLTARLPPIDEPEKMKEEQPRSGLLL